LTLSIFLGPSERGRQRKDLQAGGKDLARSPPRLVTGVAAVETEKVASQPASQPASQANQAKDSTGAFFCCGLSGERGFHYTQQLGDWLGRFGIYTLEKGRRVVCERERERE